MHICCIRHINFKMVKGNNFFNIRFNQLLFFSDFDLNRPESILMIYRYIPKLIYQLLKSFKA